MLKLFIKKWLFLIFITLSNLFLAIRTSIGFFYFLFWVFISSMGMGFVLLLLEYFLIKLKIERSILCKAEEGDTLEIETLIENNSFIPVFNFVLEDNLSCSDYQESKQRFLFEYLGRDLYETAKYRCKCPKRGRYNIGPFVVYFFDPFGLFFLKKTYKIYSEIFVFPKTFPIRGFPPIRKGILPWFGIATTHVSGNDDEFYGVREYREGDPIKRIHWISTARKNRLIVKQFQRQVFFRATILFNLEKEKNFGEGKDSVAEFMIRIAASVSRYLIERDISLDIIAGTESAVHIQSNRGVEHLQDILKFLTIAKIESKVGLGEIFEGFSRNIPDDSTLIVIMLDKDWKYMPIMLPLEKRNISLIPLILISSTFQYVFEKKEVVKDIRIKLSKTFGFNPITFSRGDNLEEVFSQISI